MARPSHIGRYAIRRELGRGAMGVVYEAHDPALERTIAIKTIQIGPDGEQTPHYEERFLLEARAAGGLNHPNIVTIYDVGRSTDGAYICMELLEGRELKEIIAADGLTLSRALEIAAQVADGLAYAHERGVVHRDVKPANIMVLPGDRVKIADFGIARKRTPEAAGMRSEVVLGSPGYLSPEQALGKPCDGRSDIFSLGVILYQMVAGRLPFRGADVSELLHQIVHTDAPAPSAANPALPTMLDRILARALAKNADGRYAGAAELAAELRACREEAHGVPVTPLQLPSEDDASITAELFETEGVSRTDELGVAAANEPSLPHRLAEAFDSSEAVLRFTTFEGTLPASNAMAARTGNLAWPDASGQLEAERAAPQAEAQRWSPRERIAFFGAVAVAVALGALIVLR